VLQIYSGLLGDKMGYALSKTDYYQASFNRKVVKVFFVSVEVE